MSKRAALLTLTFALIIVGACADEHDDSGVGVGWIDEENRVQRLERPIALGSQIELSVSEDDPENPGYARTARLSRWRVEPEGALGIGRHPMRQNLVVTALVAGSAKLVLTTDSGREHVQPIAVEAPARIETRILASPSNNVLIELPDEIARRKAVVVAEEGYGVGIDLVAFGPSGSVLDGSSIASWEATPDTLATIEPWASHNNKQLVRPSGAPGDITIRIAPRARDAVPFTTTLSIARTAPSVSEIVAYQQYCLFRCSPAERMAGEISVRVNAASKLVDVYALTANGEVVLSSATLEAKSDAGDDGPFRIGGALRAHGVMLDGVRVGDAKLTLTYAGHAIETIVHVIP